MLLGAALPLLVPKWLEPEGCGGELGCAPPKPPALEPAGRAGDGELLLELGAAGLGAGAAACGFASAIGFAAGAFGVELARLLELVRFAPLRAAGLRAGALRARALFRVALVRAEERPAADLRAAVERLAVLFRAAGLRAEVLRAEVLRAEVLRAGLLRAEVLRAPLLRAAAPVLRLAGLRAAGLRALVFLALVFLAVAPRALALLRDVDFLLVVRFFPLVLVAMMFCSAFCSAAFAPLPTANLLESPLHCPSSAVPMPSQLFFSRQR